VNYHFFQFFNIKKLGKKFLNFNKISQIHTRKIEIFTKKKSQFIFFGKNKEPQNLVPIRNTIVIMGSNLGEGSGVMNERKHPAKKKGFFSIKRESGSLSSKFQPFPHTWHLSMKECVIHVSVFFPDKFGFFFIFQCKFD
jgi:hypothetical protein